MKIWQITAIVAFVFGQFGTALKSQMSDVAYRIFQLDITVFVVGIGIIAAIESTKEKTK